MKRFLVDRIGFTISARTVTDEGYLSAPARVARVGVQKYLARELGLTDRNPNEVIGVFRPPEEVFKQESLDSYKFKELTDNHPGEMVTAKTYKDTSVGQVVSAGTQDGDYVMVDLLIKDHDAIEAVKSGKAELSAGYLAEYTPQEGVYDGDKYEFVQRDIKINHVALVDSARAGRGARIFDNQTGARKMAIIVLDADKGRKVEVDDSVAPLIEDHLDRMKTQVADASKKVESKDAEIAKLTATKDSLTEKLEKLQKESSDAAIADRVAETLKVHDTARRLVKNFDCAEKTLDAIKREVCETLYPKRDFKDRDMNYINAVFDMAEEEAEDEDEEKEKTEDSRARLARDMTHDSTSAPTADARSIVNAQLSNNWKGGKK